MDVKKEKTERDTRLLRDVILCVETFSAEATSLCAPSFSSVMCNDMSRKQLDVTFWGRGGGSCSGVCVVMCGGGCLVSSFKNPVQFAFISILPTFFILVLPLLVL